MIIKEIKLRRKFLFFKEKVVILTSDGKISLNGNWNQDLVKELDNKLKGFKIESADDFSKLKTQLSYLDSDKYLALEGALVNSIKNFWSFFNPALVQIPRPMSVVLKKNSGIKQFVVFSLNAKDFDAALNANRSVADYLSKNIKDLEKLKEEEVLMLIKEAVDKEHDLVDFELRFGVVFNDYLGDQQQYDFVSKLIEKYGISYVENPFKEDNLDMYKKLAEKYRKNCLICINSKINEYTKAVNEKVFNTVFAKFFDISSFSADINFFKENKLNIITEASPYYLDVIVGLEIPLIKLNDDERGNDVASRLNAIAKEIVTYKKSQSI